MIFDDIDLPLAYVRMRMKGGHGGHNGMKDIIDRLGTKNFPRLKIGM